jgi:UPF0755 protein
LVSYEHHELDDTDSHPGLIGADGDLLGLGGQFAQNEHPDEAEPTPALRETRAGRHTHKRRRRGRARGRFVFVLALFVVAALVVGCYALIKPHLGSSPSALDYPGAGTGTVRVQVKSGDTADAIGATLLKAEVVASTKSFTDAAAANSKSQGIQPGFYDMHSHMSANDALNILIDPDNRIVTKVPIPEGTIEQDVVGKLSTALNLPAATVQQAADNVANLGIPDGYTQVGSDAAVKSAEGFLYPDTYEFDPGTTAAAALQQMTSEFTMEDREIGFAAGAAKINLSPYSALIIASIIEGEAKFDADRAKVARVILNRLAAKKPLQIDATSVYAAKIQHLDPKKVDYATINSPYNTYLHAGLPPTPITNPGQDSLRAAVTPAPGNWTYYVNGDAAGHLYFTNSATAWKAAAQKCYEKGWGCAAP